MEEFFELVLQNSDDEKFINKWCEEKLIEVFQLEYCEDQRDRSLLVLKATSFFLHKANELDIDFENCSAANLKEKENNLIKIAKSLLQYFDFTNTSIRTTNILQLINLVTSEQHKLQFLNGSILHFVLEKIQQFKLIGNRFTSDECIKYLNSFKFNLYNPFERSTVDQIEDLDNYNHSINNIWKQCSEYCISGFTQEQFSKCLTVIQELYEFCIQRYKNDTDCPYKRICEIISYKIYSLKEQSISLFYPLVKQNNSHILKILDTLKIILAEKNNYDYSIMKLYAEELVKLINFQPYQNDSLCQKYYEKIYETVFDIYEKALQFDARIICKILSDGIIDILIKLKQSSKFEQWFLKRLCEISKSLIEKIQSNTKPDEVMENEIQTFGDYCAYIVHYIESVCNDKTLMPIHLKLIGFWLRLCYDFRFIEYSSSLFQKYSDQYKQYPLDLPETVKVIISLHNEILIKFKDDQEKLRNISKSLIQLTTLVSECVKSEPQCVKSVQRYIFKDLISKAIKENNTNVDFFYNITSLIELIKFELLNFEKSDAIILKETVKIAVKTELLKSIQPELNPLSNSRNYFYLVFFKALSKLFEKKKEITRVIEIEISVLLKQLDDMNSYTDEKNTDTYHINFLILLGFCTAIGQQSVSYKALTEQLVPIMINLFDTRQQNETIRNVFVSFLFAIHTHYIELLKFHAQKLWKYYIDVLQNDTQYNAVINSILPHTYILFQNEFSDEFFTKMLKDKSGEKLTSNIDFIIKLIHYLPKCFMECHQYAEKTRFMEFILMAKEKQEPLLTNCLLEIYALMTHELQNDVKFTEKLLPYRENLLALIVVNPPLKPTQKRVRFKKFEYTKSVEALCRAYETMANTLTKAEAKLFMGELIDLYNKLEQEKYFNDCLPILNTIKTVGNTKDYNLLRDYKRFFDAIKRKQSHTELKTVATLICYTLEGRKMKKGAQTELQKLKEETEETESDDQKSQPLVPRIPVTIMFDFGCINKAQILSKYIREKENLIAIDQLTSEIPVEKTENLIKNSNLVICLLTKDYAKSASLQNQINFAVTKGKKVISLVVEQDCELVLDNNLQAVLNDHLIRFFQNDNEITNDDRFWPNDKFNELLCVLHQTVFIANNHLSNPPKVYLSYNHENTDEASELNTKLTDLGFNCCFKLREYHENENVSENNEQNKVNAIKTEIENSQVFICCLTKRVIESSNCQEELKCASLLEKPIIVLLLEPMEYPPANSPLHDILNPIKPIKLFDDENGNTGSIDLFNDINFDKILEQLKHYLYEKRIFESKKEKALMRRARFQSNSRSRSCNIL